MQVFEILVEQSEYQAKDFDISGWKVLLWLPVIEMKMIRKVFELKEGLTWIRKMEVALWSTMIVISIMMIIVIMIVLIKRPSMFQ